MPGDSTSSRRDDRAKEEISDTTAEFEEYTAAPKLDAQGNPIPKARGLRGGGYEFPPRDPNPPLTKANLAKGATSPDSSRGGFPAPRTSAPSGPAPAPGHTSSSNSSSRRGGSPFPTPAPVDRHAPPPEMSKTADDGQSEVYERPDLHAKPRTGRGLRASGPEMPRAGEILAGWKEPTPDVVTPKRFQVFQGRDRPKEDGPALAAHNEAEIHASVDVSTAPDATMSHSASYGPTKTIVTEDPLASLRKRPVYDEAPTGSPVDDAPSDAPTTPGDEEAAHADPASTDAASNLTSPAAVAPMHAPPAHAAAPASPHAAAPSSAHAAATATPSTQVRAVPAPPELPAAAIHPVMTERTHPVATALATSRPHTSDHPRPASRAGAGCRIAIVQATFNGAITDAMLQSAVHEADRLGCTVTTRVTVPGAFDTPLAAQHLLRRDDVDAVVVIGCIIQGETGHDELIANATARSLQQVALESGKPVGLAITGPRMTEDQARARIETGAFAVASVAVQHRLLLQR